MHAHPTARLAWSIAVCVIGACTAGKDADSAVAEPALSDVDLAGGVDPGAYTLAWAGAQFLGEVRAEWAEDAEIGALSCLMGTEGTLAGDPSCISEWTDTCSCWGFFTAESRPGEQATCGYNTPPCGPDENLYYTGPGLSGWYVDSPLAIYASDLEEVESPVLTIGSGAFFRDYEGLPSDAADTQTFVVVEADGEAVLLDGATGEVIDRQ